MTQKNLFVGDKKCLGAFPEWMNTKIFLEILSVEHYSRCRNIQLNDIYYNDTEYNNRNMTHSITTLDAECCILFIWNVVMQSVITMNVMAPLSSPLPFHTKINNFEVPENSIKISPLKSFKKSVQQTPSFFHVFIEKIQL
jgi:hypothetical protein